MRASGATLSIRSRTTDASFWNEQATASRGWKRSTMNSRTSLASRCSRSGATVKAVRGAALIEDKGTKSDRISLPDRRRPAADTTQGSDPLVASILQVTTEAEALDAYSTIVTSVADKLCPSV